MEQNFGGISCSFYTVKQLATLFGKSEDAIRRWKNEGLGKDEDNIKLRAVEREDGSAGKNARHLIFSREAVIEFVKANPFLMDEAPQLGLMMQAEGAWKGSALPMPGAFADEDDWEDDEIPVPDFSGFGRMQERAVPPHNIRDDWDDDDDEIPFEGYDEDFIEKLRRESFGERTRPHRRRGRREQDEKQEKLLKAVRYAFEVLNERVDSMKKEKEDLAEGIRLLEFGRMSEACIRPLKAVAEEKIGELDEHMDMLEMFIELIAEEME